MTPLAAAWIALASCAAGAPDAPPPELLTVAERSGWRATARHDDVLSLLDRLAASSLPGAPMLRRFDMGRTEEGRVIPVVVLADPPLDTPEAARASGKVVVFAFGGIHAGEVCGKEALPMLLRELVAAPDAPANRAILDNVVLLVAPLYNADGNERVGPTTTNRPGQVGPEDGVGVRPNANGLDLNRDYMKLDAAETRAMTRLLTEWNPHVVIDTHTTNGSLHRYTLTFGAAQCPAGHPGPLEYTRDTLLPEVSRRVEAAHGWRTFFYGDFDDAHTEWRTYPWEPRFGGGYHGLRNRISILAEAYSYAPYKDRVLCTLDFVRACVAFAAERRAEIVALVERADAETVAAGRAASDQIGVRFEYASFEEPAVVLGWELAPGEDGRPRPTDRPRDYTVRHFGQFTPTLTVRRPRGYLLPASLAPIVGKLREHGVEVRAHVPGAAERVEVDRVDAIARAERPFQKRTLLTLATTRRAETRALEGVWFLAPTDQPLGNLLVYLLEPMSDDGVATWGLLDDHLRIGEDYPVLRLAP